MWFKTPTLILSLTLFPPILGFQFLSPAASGPMQIQTLPSSKKSDTPSKSHPLSAADETTDDLRAGSFVYVTENGMHTHICWSAFGHE